MTAVCPKVSKAFTLIEVVVVIAIVAIAAVGALDYQFYTVKHSQIAHTQIIAGRTVQLLLEDWKSTGGLTTYNPLNLNLGFASASVPSGFTMGQSMGSILNNSIYTITINNVEMLIILSWSDVDTDATAGTTLRELMAMVRWQQGNELCNTPVIMTAYVRLDG